MFCLSTARGIWSVRWIQIRKDKNTKFIIRFCFFPETRRNERLHLKKIQHDLYIFSSIAKSDSRPIFNLFDVLSSLREKHCGNYQQTYSKPSGWRQESNIDNEQYGTIFLLICVSNQWIIFRDTYMYFHVNCQTAIMNSQCPPNAIGAVSKTGTFSSLERFLARFACQGKPILPSACAAQSTLDVPNELGHFCIIFGLFWFRCLRNFLEVDRSYESRASVMSIIITHVFIRMSPTVLNLNRTLLRRTMTLARDYFNDCTYSLKWLTLREPDQWQLLD
jgi:hypothetical protein